MISRFLTLGCLTWAVACPLEAATPPGPAAQAEPFFPPRTPAGHPRIDGVWATEFFTMLERPPFVADLVVSPEEAREVVAKLAAAMPHNIDPDFEAHGVSELVSVRGELRTSIIVDPEDGQLPYSEAGLEQAQAVKARFDGAFDDPEQRPRPERCLENFGFAPIRAIPLFLPRRIFQTADHVVVWSEDASGLRTIHLHGEPPPDEIRSIEGYSLGRWEGDTLVVETTHLRRDLDARDGGIGRPLLIGPDTRIEERLTRVSDTELVYRYTVHDPVLYTQPWTGELSMTRHDGPLYEYACHEGNYSLPNALRGGQAEADREAEAEPTGE
ncbi:MAG TPA: hypothetical protein VMV46_10210 [Thermoanaerobaculia bacterium]|nr:hypothetical protein [Thermoanaerobaculia bacterium]